MSTAVFYKTLRDSRTMLIIALVAVLLFEVLWVIAMSNFAPELVKLWQGMKFMHKWFQALLSIDIAAGEVSLESFMGMGLVHPLLLMVSWGTLITHCTRVTVGEIDRGTADLLLTLPVTRRSVFVSATLVWILGALGFCIAALCGLFIGSQFAPLEEPLNFRKLGLVVTNLFALLLAVGGTSMCVSCFIHRRPVAVGVILGILLLSFLINFLEALIPDVMQYFTFLGFLSYYRPVEIIGAGALPWGHLLVLTSVGAVTWAFGLNRFTRMDVPAA